MQDRKLSGEGCSVNVDGAHLNMMVPSCCLSPTMYVVGATSILSPRGFEYWGEKRDFRDSFEPG